ncbi:MAG: precorrin-6y C5,15-methyltransferase (decarboxylating) subunit CbiE, partial [Alphaproteobacteria bacterium]
MSAGCRTPWLSVIGIGEDGLAGLSATARALVDDADILIGGKRHLDFVPGDTRQRLAWPSPMSELIDRIEEYRDRAVVVLASGDPLWYGVGRKLLARIPETEMTFVPSPSAFSLAAARMGWTMAGCQPVTLHGRPLDTLSLHVHPGAQLLILARDGTTPGAVAAYLTERGFGDSEMTALSHMGGPQEARLSATARTFAEQTVGHAIPDLTTIAVACLARADARWLPRTAGLADDVFRHDGKMTKREIRALALARLMPHPGALLWDIGAGCGSVAIEWLRAADNARAIG